MNALVQDSAVLELTPVEEQPAARLPAVQIAENSPMAMMLAAQRQGATLADIREMMAIQREYEANEARKAYNENMAAFKAEAIEIIKRKQVDFATAKGRTQYKHAELSDVIDAVGPALSRHGFSWSWSLKQDKGYMEVTCILKHRLGHFETATLGAPPDDSGGKNAIQSIISTKTYLERHTLKAICGVAEKGEDNDGAGAPETPPIPPELLATARAEAMKGWKPFSTWIKARTEQERNLLVPESDNLKAAAKAADAKGVAK